MDMKGIIKYFDVEDQKFVYSSENGKLFKVSHSFEKIINAMNLGFELGRLNDKAYLNSFGLDDLSVSEIESIVTQIEAVGLFEMKKNTKKESAENILLKKIILMLAQDCNLACSYCFGNQGVYHKKGLMPFETAKKAIDYLVTKSYFNNLIVTFFGGEPLICFPTIKKIVAYCREIEKESDKKFNFNITTNGTLINDEITDFFLKEKIRVQISIDGNKTMHDFFRVFHSGKGSYNTIVNRARKLIERSNVSGKATVSIHNLDFIELFEHLHSLDFSVVPITVAFSALKEEDYSRLTAEMRDFVNYISSQIKCGNFLKVKKILRTYKLLKMIHNGTIRTRLCGAGVALLSVDIDGNVYPCHRLVAEGESFCMGNLDSDIELDKFTEIAFVKEECKECWIKGLCSGGCPATNYSLTGNTSTPDINFCNYQREYILELFRLYLKMTEYEKQKLFSDLA